MKHRLTLVPLLGLLSPFITAADFQKVTPEDVGMSSERLHRIIPYMERFVESGELAGVQTLIARDGKIVHFDQVGKLNLETRRESARGLSVSNLLYDQTHSDHGSHDSL